FGKPPPKLPSPTDDRGITVLNHEIGGSDMAQTGSTKAAWAVGGTIFAATAMLLVGIWQILLGIAAIARENFFVVGPNYAYEINTTAWGWIHLGIGVLAAVAGFFLFTGATWARAVGIALAVISATANF